MQRPYLAILTAILAGALAPLGSSPGGGGAVQAASGFSSQPLPPDRLAVLGRPVGESDWGLLVLEQLQPAPQCWQQRSDGLIDPALNRFDHTGICGRYLDSNGYSLRTAGEDQSQRFRLRLRQNGSELQLLAVARDDPAHSLLIGQATIPQRDRDAFVPLNLADGWTLERRTYGSTALNHLYFSHVTPLALLLAGAGGGRLPGPPPPLPLERSAGRLAAWNQGPIPLAVVPYHGD